MTLLTRQAFWFLRHGETDWNSQNLAQGRVDIPLNAVGQAQAKTAAGLLRNRGIRAIVSSPLSRAKDTAALAAAATGAPVHYDPEFQEVSFGENEGQPMLTDWFNEWVAERFTPQNGESFVDLRERAVLAINRALTHDAAVLVVAHGALFRAIRSAMGLDPNFRTANGIPFFCQPGAEGQPWDLIPA